jgi:hypothetical protein
MKTSLILSRWPVLVSLSLATAIAADPAAAPAAKPAAPKTHVLFMGADLVLEKDKNFFPIEDVTPTAVIFKADGKALKVPLVEVVNLRITESLKLASSSVGIDHLKSERAYATGSDPFDELSKSVTISAGESAVADLANGAALRASMTVAGAGAAAATAAANPGNPANIAATAATLASAQAAQAGADAAANRAFETPVSSAFDVTAQSGKVTGEPMYDAIRLSFEVTPEKDVKNAYYGVIALIRDRDSKPGQVRKWAYVQSLGELHAGEPANVLVYRGGFPPGYILENCEVHLYTGREELATNLSRKRVPLTDDEAVDFRIVEYVGANKGRTLPAAPFTTLAPAVRFSLTATQLDETCYVRVGKNGHVIAAFRDAAGKQPVAEPELQAALKTVRFKPALEAGKPVESVTAVSPRQLGPVN